MDVSLIWYRARPSDELEKKLVEMLRVVAGDITEENVTIRAEQVPSLLASALRSGEMAVIIGGMDIRRDEENIVFIAAKCLNIQLEHGRLSRSSFMYDALRGARLPSFESAVLFPSAAGGPEGMVLTAGGKTVMILPWVDSSNYDMLSLIEEYLPMLVGAERSDEKSVERERQKMEAEAEAKKNVMYDAQGNPLPDYLARVIEKKNKKAPKKPRSYSGEVAHTLFEERFGREEARETNVSKAQLPPEQDKAPSRRTERKEKPNEAKKSADMWQDYHRWERGDMDSRKKSEDADKAQISSSFDVVGGLDFEDATEERAEEKGVEKVSYGEEMPTGTNYFGRRRNTTPQSTPSRSTAKKREDEEIKRTIADISSGRMGSELHSTEDIINSAPQKEAYPEPKWREEEEISPRRVREAEEHSAPHFERSARRAAERSAASEEDALPALFSGMGAVSTVHRNQADRERVAAAVSAAKSRNTNRAAAQPDKGRAAAKVSVKASKAPAQSAGNAKQPAAPSMRRKGDVEVNDRLVSRYAAKSADELPQEDNISDRKTAKRRVNIPAAGKEKKSSQLFGKDSKLGEKVEALAMGAAPSEKVRGMLPVLRIAAMLFIFSVIISVCYIAFNSYESGVFEPKEVYQAELAAMYNSGTVSQSQVDALPSGASERFAGLYAQNKDVSGYISIAGTDISQPIMRSYATTPNLYRSYSFYGEYDEHGSLYFHHGSTPEKGKKHYNTVVYGNAPADGSMFTALRNYMNGEYLAAHPMITMNTLYEEAQWIIFAVCVVSGDTVGEFNYCNTEFFGQYAHQIHLYNLYIRSMYYTSTEVLPDEQILTLVTDSDEFTGAKLIVCARKVRDGEDLSYVGQGVVKNDSVMMPDVWYTLNNAQKPVVPQLELPTTTTTAYTTLPTTTTTVQNTTTTNGAGGTDNAQTTTTTVNPTTIAPTYAKNMRITSGGKVIEGKACDVIAMILEAEMGSGCDIEALKAQAVAAYTYYLYSGGSAKAPNFPTKTPGERAKEAAKAVEGQYITYNGVVPYTPYYAISAGKTANNADINGTDLKYLVSVDCTVDESVSGYRVVKEVSAVEVARKVKDSKGIDLTAIADKSTWFEILERDGNDLYVLQVRVGDKTYKGNTLHLSILGYSCLRSPCFWIEYDADADKFIFTSLGYGTGVGMSQTGANEYAKQGYNYVWIIEHFYPGAKIKS